MVLKGVVFFLYVVIKLCQLGECGCTFYPFHTNSCDGGGLRISGRHPFYRLEEMAVAAELLRPTLLPDPALPAPPRPVFPVDVT
jgi:hypothetical protein